MLSADQRALLRLAVAASRGVDASGALAFKARLARRSAASRLSSACVVETAAMRAARRWAELGRCFVGCTDTVTLSLAAITVSLGSISLMPADRGVPRLRVSASRSQVAGSGQRSEEERDLLDLLLVVQLDVGDA